MTVQFAKGVVLAFLHQFPTSLTHFNFSVSPHIYVIVHLSICPELPFCCYLFRYLVSIHFLHYTRSLDYSYSYYIGLERIFSRQELAHTQIGYFFNIKAAAPALTRNQALIHYTRIILGIIFVLQVTTRHYKLMLIPHIILVQCMSA